MIMKKYLFGALIGLGAFTLVGGAVALASSGNGFGSDRMMETKAEIFGMTVDELQAARETMDFEEIAAVQGVDIDAMHEQMQARAVERWTERGFSEEQITERLQMMEERHAEGGPHMGGMGFGQKGGGKGMQLHDANGDGVCDLN
jgi:hypothetical protein